MLVEELIEELKKLNPKSVVYLQIDQEGNGYEKLYAVDGECVYYYDTVYDTRWTADDACMLEEEWIALKNQDKCVVLAP